MNVEKVTNDLISWIRNWFDENGKDCNAVIGISGGKDSTVVAGLCVKALGKDRVIGVMMPNGDQKDISDSIKICDFLGIKNYIINIEQPVERLYGALGYSMNRLLSEQTKTNLPARIRMTTLYGVSQTVNGRVANTCNLSEDTCGYATRYGDGAGDFSPLSKLTVAEILQIGDHLGLPYELVHKTPIDGLKTNPDGSYVTDEQSLGFSYANVDDYIRNGGKNNTEEINNKIASMEAKNRFKLELMPAFEPNKEDL